MNVKKVLVIDDEAAMRFLLEKQLARAGFTVCTAADGPSGLMLAESHHPDYIVLDLMMPEMDGFEVCRYLKTNPQTADIPVIFLSASTSREHQTMALSLGAIGFLSKPFDIAELPSRLQTPTAQPQARPRPQEGGALHLAAVGA